VWTTNLKFCTYLPEVINEFAFARKRQHNFHQLFLHVAGLVYILLQHLKTQLVFTLTNPYHSEIDLQVICPWDTVIGAYSKLYQLSGSFI